MNNVRRLSHFCYQDRCKGAVVREKFGRCVSCFRRLSMSVAVAILMADSVVAAPRPQVPDDRAVAKVVDDFFASQPGYQKGDLITRSQVDKIVAKLLSDGARISQPASVVKLALADDSFIVRELSTPVGMRFMRKVALRNGGFSHLDRLSTIPRGQSLISDLVRMKDGDKMIEYLVTTKGGKKMGEKMAQVRGGVDLNKPTGRIYTAEDLVAALRDAMAKP